MSYFFSGFQKTDSEQTLLGKILNLLGAVAKGTTGWLVRGNVSVLSDGDVIGNANPLPTSSAGFSSTVQFSRPQNTTAYSANDVVGTGGVLQVETATAAGTITAQVAQVETATASGTITSPVQQVETATVIGTVTPGTSQVETATVLGTVSPGTSQVETATAAGTITGSGTVQVIVTAAGIAGSPITLNVPVLNTDTAATWAGKVRDALNLIDAITDVYTVGGSTTAISLTEISPDGNDSTLNISLNNGTCTGVTPALTSVNTTAGVAPGTGNATVTVTGTLISGSPLAVSVPVVAADNASAVAGKVRTALAATSAISSHYTVGGTGADVTLTEIGTAGNDSTLNIAIANGTCTGLTAAPTSANTTAGVLPGGGYATVVVTGAAIAHSPRTVRVTVAAGDSASTVAGKIRTALGALYSVSSQFTVSGTGADVVLTRAVAAANDATLNISISNGTCTGLTAAPTSVDTTAGVASGTGNASVTVTGAGISGSPVVVPVAVVAGDTAATWAGKVRTALTANAAVTSLYTVGGASTSITLTRTVPAANDATLNIALANDTCSGINEAATSTNTTAGVAPGTGNASVTITSADIEGSPLTIPVAVTQGDTAATWAGKVRTALAANAAVSSIFTVGGSTTSITLTRVNPAANDATLNIALDNGTCTGITPALTSADTTAGLLTSANAGTAVLEFQDIGPEGGYVFIVGSRLRIDVSSVPLGMSTFRLHLYNERPDEILDNAAFDLSSAGDREKYLGFIDLDTPVDIGSTLFVTTEQARKVTLADGSTSLFGVLQTTGGFTPTSGAVKTLTLETVS